MISVLRFPTSRFSTATRLERLFHVKLDAAIHQPQPMTAKEHRLISFVTVDFSRSCKTFEQPRLYVILTPESQFCVLNFDYSLISPRGTPVGAACSIC
jgi:hypothetical protein